ncbi:MAG: RloB family protein [Desulfobulbaceae bacterium]|nr:RloB family protein [Desulfobulbaceae bacterium]
MGADQLFHRRKAKKAASLAREAQKREPYDLVLIVCEGGKTEPNYLQELRDAFKLSTANIKIIGDACGTSPRDVVKYALTEYQKEKKYNRIFCVFDKDRHPTFNEALERIRTARLSKGDSIQAITSVPCFEIWILLHFRYTTKAFSSTGPSGSICASVIRDLKRHIGNYDKGAAGLFPSLLEKLPTAMTHATRLAKHTTTTGSDNPSTRMHKLVEYLRDLKK